MAVLVQHIGFEGRGSPKIGDFGLVRDDGFNSAVYMSLFLDARAEDGDLLDDPSDVRGYWGETYGFPAGSRLWLLRRRKRDQTTLNLIEEYAIEALAWMVRDQIVQSTDVTVELNGASRIDLQVRLVRLDGTQWDSRWDDVLG